jgi:hypothetical protein
MTPSAAIFKLRVAALLKGYIPVTAILALRELPELKPK